LNTFKRSANKFKNVAALFLSRPRLPKFRIPVTARQRADTRVPLVAPALCVPRAAAIPASRKGKVSHMFKKAAALGLVVGTSSNLTDFTSLASLTSASIVQDYSVKHNPFAYFKSVQEGMPKENGLQNVVCFEGPRGLFADLATGNVPELAFIAPNRCNDQHGRGNADAYCAFDPGIGTAGLTNGTQVGLNGGLILQGDNTH